nr:immunoglobulin light chain junction region [Macaca mulatta]MOV77912.1 immunoglobulin light chain junction region [Macaca mulatta]MOV77913.1 immunoglobulin light chain junction region [Macaca mulatta]MOV78041.1 immunoglobulin light chain junction region [Macaca mulatta]MOV78073.1 immunoglobulin light chain junction region [Macaca mulatta]
CMQALEFPFTF